MRPASSGFTLLELAVVVLLIGIIAGVTFPRFYPAIAFTELQRSARHIANFGRAAMSEATMLQQDITIRIDFKEMRISAVRWVVPEEEEENAAAADQAGSEDMLAMLAQMRGAGIDPNKMANRVGVHGASGMPGLPSDYARYMANFEDYGDMPEGFDPDMADQQMKDKFDAFVRRGLLARAQNVIQDSMLEEVDLFEGNDFSLDIESEPVEMPLENPLLHDMRLPESVRLESVEIDGVAQSKGLVEIELTSLGLASRVVFYFANEDGDYYTVLWDPMLGGAMSFPGKETFS